jgi:hypothetical protein
MANDPPINIVPTVDAQFWRLFTIENFQGKKMFSKTHLGFLKKLLKNGQ